jgi:membrane dipeptidase
MFSRRRILKATAGASALLMLGGCAGRKLKPALSCRELYHALAKQSFSARAIDLVNHTLVIDMMAALGTHCRQYWFAPPYDFAQADADYLAGSGVRVFHMAPGLPRQDAYAHAREYLHNVTTAVSMHPQQLVLITQTADFARLMATDKLGCLLGIQNSTHFRSVADVNAFWEMGQRVSQITQNQRNRLGSGSMETQDTGLTAYGAEVIQRMNQLGMAVDVAHCGDRTTLDSITASSRPVLITHANCRALNPGYARCKTDEAIKRMAATGGVMGLTGLRAFVRNSEPTTIEHFLDHVDHIARLVGIEYVGIGSDQDVMPNLHDVGANSDYYRGLPKKLREFYRFRDKSIVDGLNQYRRMYAITEGLIKRGYSDTDIQGVLGLNFQRALAEIWS